MRCGKPGLLGGSGSPIVMTRHTRCVVTVPARRFESSRGSGCLLTSIQYAVCGYGATLMGADRSFPARGPWFWPCVGSRRPDFRRCFWRCLRNGDYRRDATFPVSPSERRRDPRLAGFLLLDSIEASRRLDVPQSVLKPGHVRGVVLLSVCRRFGIGPSRARWVRNSSLQQRFTAGRLPRYPPSCSGQMRGLRHSRPLRSRFEGWPNCEGQRRAGLALADALHLRSVEGIQLPAALALLLRADLIGT